MTKLWNSKNNRLSRFVIIMCLLIAFVCTMSYGALAAEKIDTGKTCTLALDCLYNDSPLQGMTFSLYRVADGSTETGFTLDGNFANLRVNLNDLTTSGWKTAANTLATYIKPYDIPALAAGTSDENGSISFTALSTGLYLIVGDTLSNGGKSYQTAPLLIALPGLQKDGAWLYNVSAFPKIATSSTPIGDETVDITVLKVWNDSGKTDQRPESIEVTLLRDGKEYETYTLNAAVYWRHTWTELSAKSSWSVIEKKVPENYYVTYSTNQSILTISNTYAQKTTTGGDTLKSGKTGKLPQTGMIWWPVYVMAGLGILLFGFGWRDYIRRRKTDEK